MDDRGVRRGSWVSPIKEDPDQKGAGCSGPAVQAGSGLTVPGLAEVASCRSHPLRPLPSSICQLFIRMHNETLSVVAAIMVSVVRLIGSYKPPFPIPHTQSAFHRTAQRNAFRRRDARLQSRSFARWNPRLTEIEQVHGCFSSQSFWKRGSFRSGRALVVDRFRLRTFHNCFEARKRSQPVPSRVQAQASLIKRI